MVRRRRRRTIGIIVVLVLLFACALGGRKGGASTTVGVLTTRTTAAEAPPQRATHAQEPTTAPEPTVVPTPAVVKAYYVDLSAQPNHPDMVVGWLCEGTPVQIIATQNVGTMPWHRVRTLAAGTCTSQYKPTAPLGAGAEGWVDNFGLDIKR